MYVNSQHSCECCLSYVNSIIINTFDFITKQMYLYTMLHLSALTRKHSEKYDYTSLYPSHKNRPMVYIAIHMFFPEHGHNAHLSLWFYPTLSAIPHTQTFLKHSNNISTYIFEDSNIYIPINTQSDQSASVAAIIKMVDTLLPINCRPLPVDCRSQSDNSIARDWSVPNIDFPEQSQP